MHEEDRTKIRPDICLCSIALVMREKSQFAFLRCTYFHLTLTKLMKFSQQQLKSDHT
jgi:hypothetical protein